MAEIIVGIDGSAGSERALRWAVGEARLRDVRVRAVLAWAASGPPREHAHAPPSTSPQHPRWVAQQVLLDVVGRVRKADPTALIVERSVFAPPVQALLAQSVGAVMLVVGARDRSVAHPLLAGSVSTACVDGATVPVVVVRDHGTESRDSGPVVVGVDGSAASIAVLRWAGEEARLRGVPLRVVHAYRPTPPGYADHVRVDEQAVGRAAAIILGECIAAGLGEAPDLQVDGEVVIGGTAPALIAATVSAQILVLGARGAGGFTDLRVGSTTTQCLTHAHCPVVVVPTPPSG